MAVGRGAHAGPGSIAIGADAGAGSDIVLTINTLGKVVENSNDSELIQAFSEFCTAIQDPKSSKTKVQQIWGVIKSSATLNDAIGLVSKISAWVAGL